MTMLKAPNGKKGIGPRASSCCNHDETCAVHAEPHDEAFAACTCPEYTPLFRHKYRAPAPQPRVKGGSCT